MPKLEACQEDPSRIWITLITRASYLPGVVLLVHSLYKHGSVHPIVVQYTSALPDDCVRCLEDLAIQYPLCRQQLVEPIALPKDLKTIASRFDDTLTKLRAFEPIKDQNVLTSLKLPCTPKDVCFLDADIMIFQNPDDIFEISRPTPHWILAHHACVCNIDNDPWASPEWNVENCPCTSLVHPSALEAPAPKPKTVAQQSTYKLLNSGVFVCTPSREIWQQMDAFRVTDPRVETFAFPDQNFLDVFFEGQWKPLGWQYNAVKTHRYWHSASWRDDEVKILHYIVDKPWEKRGGQGYRGRDSVTHSWWWDEYDAWYGELSSQGESARRLLETVEGYVDTKKESA
ncbi:putative glycosyl transferase, family 8, nucleotide-diphospho-sugar transferase [Septoria linicola]|nr:putative glycosyl transferase, family 8, nucleotide-diphospho-sugar transferase [Septoria linicola]